MPSPHSAHRARAAASTALGLLAAACTGSAAPPARSPVTVAVPPSPGIAPAEPAPAEQGRYRCTVDVRSLGPQFVGEASSDTNESLAEEAERDACKKIWEAAKIDCHDEARVITVSRQTKLTIINGQTSHTARVVMQTIGGTYSGAGRSAQSGNEACNRAVGDACSKAPAGSDCSGRGLYCSPSPDDPATWHCSATPPAPKPHHTPSPFEV